MVNSWKCPRNADALMTVHRTLHVGSVRWAGSSSYLHVGTLSSLLLHMPSKVIQVMTFQLEGGRWVWRSLRNCMGLAQKWYILILIPLARTCKHIATQAAEGLASPSYSPTQWWTEAREKQIVVNMIKLPNQPDNLCHQETPRTIVSIFSEHQNILNLLYDSNVRQSLGAGLSHSHLSFILGLLLHLACTVYLPKYVCSVKSKSFWPHGL